jgi:predicted Co/Zn/Cd cation transporter (cation efflux family)
MENNPQQKRRSAGTTAMDGAMALIAVLLIVQIWILSAALEAFLAGHRETALPAAIVSGLLFLICFALYLFVERIDRNSRGS